MASTCRLSGVAVLRWCKSPSGPRAVRVRLPAASGPWVNEQWWHMTPWAKVRPRPGIRASYDAAAVYLPHAHHRMVEVRTWMPDPSGSSSVRGDPFTPLLAISPMCSKK